MKSNELQEERLLLSALEERKMKAFMRLYKYYGEDLLIFAYAHLQDPTLAIETVDAFFEKLWSEANFMEIHPPIYKFLLEQIREICEQKSIC
jgi:DNA-directed RNA polymerase specialized sigma24 family protein